MWNCDPADLDAVVEDDVWEILQRLHGVQDLEEEGGAGHQEGDDPHTQKSDRSPNLLHAVLSRVHYDLRQANNK